MKLQQYPTIIDRKIRVGLIGCGRISKTHFDSIQSHSQDLELTAVCDIDASAMRAKSALHQVPGYIHVADMLRQEKLDLVALCTPSGLHPEHAILAAQYGVNVLTEKPMGTRLIDGITMVKACDQAAVRLFVVKQNRRNRTLQFLKQAVDKDRFGRIYNVAMNVFWTRPQEYYDQGNGWRGTWEFDGGALMNQASHYIDLLDWIVGPVESVMAYTATQARRIEAEDSGVAAIRWRSGAMGTLNVSMLTYPKNLEGSITIIGENGTARVGGMAVNEIQEWHFADVQPEDEYITSASYITDSVYGLGHPLYYDNVIKTLRGQAEPDTDGRSGLKSLELLAAMYRSAREGVKVSLPLDY
jgi:UDP-N-acetyl-2-amino-2-deoxyglucuronate dehydrogenase